MKRRITTAALAGLTLVATGCSFTANDLARANNNRGGGYIVKVVVPDALNLPDGAPVRIGGVSIGRVHSVKADNYEAIVSLRINDDTLLTDAAMARLRYTTALGEMYVQIEPSEQGTPLTDGQMLARNQAETAPSVEDALASASLLINGGGLGSIQTIVTELNTALEGRIPATHSLINRLDTFLSTVSNSEREIDRILKALAASSITLNQRESTINNALTEIRPAAKILADNTDELVALLKQANKLGRTAKRIVDTNRDDITVIVKELGPVLAEVNNNSSAVLGALDAITGAAGHVDGAVPGNFANLYLVVHLGVDTLGIGGLPGTGSGDTGPLDGVGEVVGGVVGGLTGGTTGGTTGGLLDLGGIL